MGIPGSLKTDFLLGLQHAYGTAKNTAASAMISKSGTAANHSLIGGNTANFKFTTAMLNGDPTTSSSVGRTVQGTRSTGMHNAAAGKLKQLLDQISPADTKTADVRSTAVTIDSSTAL